MTAGLAEAGQRLITNADHALDQKRGHDREPVPHPLGLAQIQIRCLAAAHDIEEARPVDETRDRRDFF
jgi:hypothetical protein